MMKRHMMIGVLSLAIIPVISGSGPSQSSTPGPASTASVCLRGSGHYWLAKQSRVFDSVDGGRTWKLSFRGAFHRPSQFEATIGCAGQTVWALFVGPGGASSQKPYVVYRTVDGGHHWVAEMEEPFFGSLYPRARAPLSVGAFPGPFVVVNRNTAYFVGADLATGPTGTVRLSATRNAGHTWLQRPIPCLSAFRPLVVQFASADEGWLIGTCKRHNTLLLTKDGGRRWSRRALP